MYDQTGMFSQQLWRNGGGASYKLEKWKFIILVGGWRKTLDGFLVNEKDKLFSIFGPRRHTKVYNY